MHDRVIAGKITQKGFTLLEVLLTIGVFAVTLSIIAAILSNHFVLFRDSQAAGNNLQEVQLAIDRTIHYLERDLELDPEPDPSAAFQRFDFDADNKVLVYNDDLGPIKIAEGIAVFDKFPNISGQFRFEFDDDPYPQAESFIGFRIKTDSPLEGSGGFLVILRKEKPNTKPTD